eukprot:CAMPEP_0183743944 /NCGR_PEP_ID=MMETSP0737-20130205/65478_1 /TAXON_ID=385413 /ORGANISM="Thalassiosira miniscula, Strain CCMP1093" /LENGTH=151 /DNA_ID=CAMNT_0025979577 /DNA_START=66 /DNA_END=518 /DNA_ORIENTATION=-
MMSSTVEPSSAAAPSWTNTSSNSNRPAPIEDIGTGATSSSSSTGMDELLAPVCTLDEPVMETIMRDVRAVGAKLKAVLLPLDRNRPFGYMGVLQEESVEPSDGQRNVLNQLRDWDLWGPLFICLSLAVILSTKAPSKQTSHVFTTVFVVMW